VRRLINRHKIANKIFKPQAIIQKVAKSKVAIEKGY
jgi:hypothetical protein